jgi:hypothetical protein
MAAGVWGHSFNMFIHPPHTHTHTLLLAYINHLEHQVSKIMSITVMFMCKKSDVSEHFNCTHKAPVLIFLRSALSVF